MTKPNFPGSKSETCNGCNDSIRKQKPKFCDFCSHQCCDKCLHKKCKFGCEASLSDSQPGKTLSSSILSKSKNRSSSTVDTDSTSYGKICKVCDRKYLIFKMYSRFVNKVKKRQALLKERKEVLRQVQTEFISRKTAFKAMKQDHAESMIKIED